MTKGLEGEGFFDELEDVGLVDLVGDAGELGSDGFDAGHGFCHVCRDAGELLFSSFNAGLQRIVVCLEPCIGFEGRICGTFSLFQGDGEIFGGGITDGAIFEGGEIFGGGIKAMLAKDATANGHGHQQWEARIRSHTGSDGFLDAPDRLIGGEQLGLKHPTATAVECEPKQNGKFHNG